ncbi:MAG TPA: DUF4142 domain-containing protein [Leptolyngbyaceae cyanobacterium]
MKTPNFLHKTTALLGAIAMTSAIGIPALAQSNSRPGGTGGGQTPSTVNQQRPSTQQQPSSQQQPSNQQRPTTQQPSNQQRPTTQQQPSNQQRPTTQQQPSNQQRPNQQQPSARPQTPANQQSSADFTTLDREFIRMAAEGNNAEIQTSQLALQKAADQSVRQYAQQMITEHTQANQRLASIAAQYGVTLPTSPGPLQVAIAQQLSQLSGPQFDRAYMGVQENAHLSSVALYRTALDQGGAANVQAYAAEILPRVQEHFEMANRMSVEMRADVNQPARPANQL